MEAPPWPVSSFIYSDVSVARVRKTSLTCLGPDKRPPYSVSAALSEHRPIFLWKNSLSALRPYTRSCLISLSHAGLFTCWDLTQTQLEWRNI